jgi:hypothetical protein
VLVTLRPRRRFWIEAGLSVLCGLLFVLTLAVHDWIEAVFGVDPDQHSGSLEWAIVAALFLTAAAFGLVARREWRAAEPPSAIRRVS